MIATSRSTIFVHIPKTGGQSVERLFLSLEGLTWSERSCLGLGPNANRSRGPQSLAHLRARDYVTFGHVTQEEFDSYFSFCFVRNPWARLVSEYKYRTLPRWVSFRRWVEDSLPAEPEWSDSYDHLAPQHEYVTDEDGKLLIDFIGRFERLSVDFQYVADRLDLPVSDLPHTNNSMPTGSNASWMTVARSIINRPRKWRRGYMPYYDSRTRDLVSNIYASDIERFGYTFNG